MALRTLTEATLLPRFEGDVHLQPVSAGETVDVPDRLLEGPLGLDARGVTVEPEDDDDEAPRRRRRKPE